ncbi:MAG: RHS repeat protein, partial [Bacteroidaceae bacterium]|nr:RHS repeat protein [Bacteroidaceae bacterium]
MKLFSLLSFLGATLCILWACDPVDIDEPENGKNNGQGNKNDSVQITVDWSDPDWYTVNFWDRTDRQKAGLRGPVKKWHIDNYSTYNEYEYDRAGRLVREAYVNTRNEGSNYEWIYTYDAQGHLTKAECFDVFCENGEPCEYWEYEYENTGKYVAREWFMMGPQISDAENAICKELSKASFVVVQPLSSTYRQYTYTFRNDSLVICEYSYNTDLGNDEKLNEVTYDYAFAYENGYPKSLQTDKLRFQIDNITYYPNGMYKDFVYREENAYNFETGWDVHSYTMLDNPRYLEVDTFSLGGRASYMSLTPQSIKKTYDSHFDIVKNEEWY